MKTRERLIRFDSGDVLLVARTPVNNEIGYCIRAMNWDGEGQRLIIYEDTALELSRIIMELNKGKDKPEEEG